jgi:HK97 family phage major capsid protein
MSRTAIRTYQGYETTSGMLFNRPFATVGNPAMNAVGNTGLQLLGYPVWEAPSAPATMITSAAEVTWFGDPRSYIVVDRVGMDISVIDNLFAQATALPNGTRGIFAMWRNMAKAVNNDAGRLLKINAP